MLAKDIEAEIDAGKTLLITTYLRQWRINSKTLEKWRKAGRPLFRDGDEGGRKGFYMARGRSWDFVMPGMVSVRFV